MVVSTINSQSLPESAVVAFGCIEDFQLVFGTSIDSRKAKNISQNGNVSVVIGWDDKGTIQYNGIARMLEGDEVEKYSEVYFKKNPTARRYKDNPSERYFLIEPTWLRFTEVAVDPWKITELHY